MKKMLLLSATMLAVTMIFAQSTANSNGEVKKANISWLNSATHNFGSVVKGQSVLATFEFANNGDESLVITNAKGSCGCTSVLFPKEPIAPGDKGIIEATFNATSVGNFNKSITVTSNAGNERIILHIKGQVIENDALK